MLSSQHLIFNSQKYVKLRDWKQRIYFYIVDPIQVTVLP